MASSLLKTIRRADRIGQRHPQGPARPGSPRRAHFEGTAIRVAQRILAMAAAIWHNNKTSGNRSPASLIAYDH